MQQFSKVNKRYNVILMILCIIINLIVGNLILYIMWKNSFAATSGESWFDTLNITMSLSGILCYCILFLKVPFREWTSFRLCLISIATWLAILFIGIFAVSATLWNQPEDNKIVVGILSNIFMSFVFAICGTVMFSFIAIPMGLINVFWLIRLKKHS
ncbi:glucan phosphoethanolaminetransferase (alkaline phosphatase superfamily) [Dysgonomonas sp. PFB1-18]|uniref:hypothetical protein n=1 Tax=unclassified Dysgonomonas TaxID=2630389 RepID=UPI002476B78F|nr:MULTISPECIES: hypothetical protein [unclassified Dysgonomonas]MDH6308380.1 glucan phosphoethanolaminetransferase (alkaline phosphatase superfamily) [Dysgonomonas sp. PF1-14]MDH6338183.1 hypothetical protein [Dysgonomonas sp. PF1-16]MDH6379680.1 glucan phosphoethanolaminetransferase (alkaline phosphatase superfamily) [Dysgonomonas sp. PFB1-18]MDH6397231.1 hypothetical protein [Dysgonomonas sp. PF1-23]